MLTDRRKSATVLRNDKMYEDFMTGKYTLKELGKKYGVTETAVSQLLTFRLKKRKINRVTFQKGNNH